MDGVKAQMQATKTKIEAELGKRGFDSSRFLRLILCLLSFLVMILSIAACASTCSSFELEGGFDVFYTLWRYEVDGPTDDKGKIQAKVKGSKFRNYKAFELGRASTIFALLVSLPVASYFGIAVWKAKGNKTMDFGAALMMLVATVLLWAGSGYYQERLSKNEFYKDPKTEEICDSGCALAIAASIFGLFVVLGAFFLALPRPLEGARLSDSKVAPDDLESNRPTTDSEKTIKNGSGEETKEAVGEAVP